MSTSEQSKKNIKLALVLASTALVFVLGFVLKMVTLGGLGA